MYFMYFFCPVTWCQSAAHLHTSQQAQIIWDCPGILTKFQHSTDSECVSLPVGCWNNHSWTQHWLLCFIIGQIDFLSDMFHSPSSSTEYQSPHSPPCSIRLPLSLPWAPVPSISPHRAIFLLLATDIKHFFLSSYHQCQAFSPLNDHQCWLFFFLPLTTDAGYFFLVKTSSIRDTMIHTADHYTLYIVVYITYAWPKGLLSNLDHVSLSLHPKSCTI